LSLFKIEITFKLKVGTGVVICLRHEALPIDNNTLALPI
jgi:hypothetical protein